MEQFTETELWDAVKTMSHAREYLESDAAERDIYWTLELDEACILLSQGQTAATKSALKLERKRS